MTGADEYTRTMLTRASGRGCGRWPSCCTPRARADQIWAFCTGRKTAADAARAIAEIRQLSDTIATRAREEFRAVA
jgi:hypothetical protein